MESARRDGHGDGRDHGAPGYGRAGAVERGARALDRFRNRARRQQPPRRSRQRCRSRRRSASNEARSPRRSRTRRSLRSPRRSASASSGRSSFTLSGAQERQILSDALAALPDSTVFAVQIHSLGSSSEFPLSGDCDGARRRDPAVVHGFGDVHAVRAGHSPESRRRRTLDHARLRRVRERDRDRVGDRCSPASSASPSASSDRS